MKIVCIHYETIDAYYAEMALNSTRHHLRQPFKVQQGLEILGFWVQKKTVQLKIALREVYTYVLKGFFFQKTVYLQGFCSKSMFHEVKPMY